MGAVEPARETGEGARGCEAAKGWKSESGIDEGVEGGSIERGREGSGNVGGEEEVVERRGGELEEGGGGYWMKRASLMVP